MFKAFKIGSLLSLCVLFVLLIGCGSKQVEYLPQIVEKEVYVPYVPQLPDVECQFQGTTEVETIRLMLECISLQKKVLNSLKLPNGFTNDNFKTQEPSNGIFNPK